MIRSPVGSARYTSLPSGPGYTHRLVASSPATATTTTAAVAASAARAVRQRLERREQCTVMTPRTARGRFGPGVTAPADLKTPGLADPRAYPADGAVGNDQAVS